MSYYALIGTDTKQRERQLYINPQQSYLDYATAVSTPTAYSVNPICSFRLSIRAFGRGPSGSLLYDIALINGLTLILLCESYRHLVSIVPEYAPYHNRT